MKKLFQVVARQFGYDLNKININSKSRSTLLHLFGRKRHEELIIFDVGAHQGQTIEEYSKLFPNARFFSFEPFPETYERLAKHQSAKVHTFPFGLSDKVESQTFFTNKGSGTNSLLVLSDAAQTTWSGHQDLHATGSVTCDFSTLDQFVVENAIASIDFLKIDVQGAEYKVLAGGENTLKSGMANVVKCEVILSETYQGQHPLHEYLARFDELGFDLVNICDQVYGVKGGLIQVDVVLQHKSHSQLGD